MTQTRNGGVLKPEVFHFVEMAAFEVRGIGKEDTMIIIVQMCLKAKGSSISSFLVPILFKVNL